MPKAKPAIKPTILTPIRILAKHFNMTTEELYNLLLKEKSNLVNHGGVLYATREQAEPVVKKYYPLTTSDLAARVGCDVSSIHIYAVNGKLKTFVTVGEKGGRRRFNETSVQECRTAYSLSYQKLNSDEALKPKALPAPTNEESPTEKRLKELEKEVAALRETVVGMHASLAGLFDKTTERRAAKPAHSITVIEFLYLIGVPKDTIYDICSHFGRHTALRYKASFGVSPYRGEIVGKDGTLREVNKYNRQTDLPFLEDSWKSFKERGAAATVVIAEADTRVNGAHADT